MAEDRPDAKRAARASRVVHALLGLIGLGLALYGGWLLIDAVRFAAVAEPATGTVVSVETVTTQATGNEGISFIPTIRFETGDGAVHEAGSHISSTGYDFRAGETVEVLYDPARPDEVRIGGPFSLWALPVAFFAVGVALLGAALASELGLFRAGREPASP